MDKIVLKFTRLSEAATPPFKASVKAAGYDLCSASDGIVPKQGKAKFPTDLAIQVPEGTYGRIAPRSGIALRSSIHVGAGVLDEDYRGNVSVLLFNHGTEDFIVNIGDRIAQLICQRIYHPSLKEISELEESSSSSDQDD